MNNQGSSPEGPGRKVTSGRGRSDFYFCFVAQINSLFFNHTFHHSICFPDCSFPYISSLNLVFVCVYFFTFTFIFICSFPPILQLEFFLCDKIFRYPIPFSGQSCFFALQMPRGIHCHRSGTSSTAFIHFA